MTDLPNNAPGDAGADPFQRSLAKAKADADLAAANREEAEADAPAMQTWPNPGPGQQGKLNPKSPRSSPSATVPEKDPVKSEAAAHLAGMENADGVHVAQAVTFLLKQIVG